MDLILIEGVPGSGKSTLAEKLCEAALAKGLKASWYLEEAREHPVHPHIGSAREVSEKYYLDQWQMFVDANKTSDQLFILEGSLFQSTVRFIVQAALENSVEEYFINCETILAQVNTYLIYLRPTDITAHIDWLMDHRGQEWSCKVSSYLEQTQYNQNHNLRGPDGMKVFWSDYGLRCDKLVDISRMPKHIQTSGKGFYEAIYKDSITALNRDLSLDLSTPSEL